MAAGALRILAGSAKGAKLAVPDEADVRPATGRLRQSLFDILRPDLPDGVVLDLFAGSGALAIEALSRGAAWATMVDRSGACVEAIRRNVEKLRFADRAVALCADALACADRVVELGRAAAIVFIDPPYALVREAGSRGRMIAAVADLQRRGAIAPDALIAWEHPTGLELGLDGRREAYGQTSVVLTRGRIEVS